MARRRGTRRLPAGIEAYRGPIHGVAPSLSPPSATALLLWSVLAVGILGGASAVLELDEVVSAPARIEPSGQVRHIQHYEGGTIREVLVREGAQVREGDVLVRLVNSQGAQDLADRQARWAAVRARAARLTADLAGRVAIDWPRDLAVDADIRRRELQIHDERLSHRQQQITVIVREIERHQHEVVEAETKTAGLLRAQAKGAEEMRAKKRAHDAGVVGDQELLRLERETLMLDTEVSTTRDSISRMKAQQREAEAKLAEFEKGWRSGVLDEIGKAEAELGELRATMAVANDRESRSEVRSPVRGIVKMAAITSVGQVAKPGDTLMDIMPADDALVVEAKVAPQDIGQIREGLHGNVRLSAFDPFRYGHLDGTVSLVGVDAIDESHGNTVTTFYRVLIVAERSALRDGAGLDHPIRSGMVGTASIVIGRKPILRMVLDPLLRSDMVGTLGSLRIEWRRLRDRLPWLPGPSG
jgi:adhesin transport system membrane fusion protein